MPGTSKPDTPRLGRGTYSATDFGSIVSVNASGIQMSGISPHAELVHIPTFAPPMRYKLLVYEHHPQLDNLVIGSASALFAAGGVDEKIGKVQIEDSDGLQDVDIQVIPMEKSNA